MKEIINECRQRFAMHQATLVQDTDRYLIIDWRKENGSSDYYVNYIVDKQRGSLIVSGDLGDSIATWYNRVEPAKLKKWIYNDIGYYVGKFQCASDTYTYDMEDVLSDIIYHLDDYDICEYIEHNDKFDDEEDFWDCIKQGIDDAVRQNSFVPTDQLEDILRDIDADYWEWLYDCGKRIHLRVNLWAVGFYMACEQLGI